MTDTLMDVKQRIAIHATEYYKKKITPYEFIMAQIDKSDFSILQLFSDDMHSNVLNVNLDHYYIFAYEIHPNAINDETRHIIDQMPSLGLSPEF